jgi:hypothetical protein
MVGAITDGQTVRGRPPLVALRHQLLQIFQENDLIKLPDLLKGAFKFDCIEMRSWISLRIDGGV